MKKSVVAFLVALVVIPFIVVGIVISWSRIAFQFDYWQLSQIMDTLWEGRTDPHPLKTELPMLSREVVRLQFKSSSGKTAYGLNSRVVVEIANDLMQIDGEFPKFSNGKLEVAIKSSELNKLGPCGLQNVSNSQAREYLNKYFRETTPYQLAKDVFGASLRSINTAESVVQKYRNMYLYSMKAVLLPYTARYCATEVSSEQTKGFIFGKFPENKGVLVEACSADGGPFVVLYVKNLGGATQSDVLKMLSTVVIRSDKVNKPDAVDVR